jgi:hypothetical protein
MADTQQIMLEMGAAPANTIEEWLQSLHMSQYLDRFNSHAVRLEDVGELTSELLKEMGVNAVGACRKRVVGAVRLPAAGNVVQRIRPV